MSDTLADVAAAAKKGPDVAPKPARGAGGRFAKKDPKGGTKTTTKRSGPGRPPKLNLEKELTGFFTMLGTALVAGGLANPKLSYDGRIILENAESLAKGLREAADRSPAIHRALEVLVVGSTFSVLGVTLTKVLIPIAANHGALPPMTAGLVGAPIPGADSDSVGGLLDLIPRGDEDLEGDGDGGETVKGLLVDFDQLQGDADAG